MLTITVYLLAFTQDNEEIPTREVDIPNPEDGDLRDLVFYYGQNDFQPKPIRSVCVGDVFRLPDGTLHRVLGMGFEELPEDTDINKLERGSKALLR